MAAKSRPSPESKAPVLSSAMAFVGASLLLMACSGQSVKDQAPFVQVTAWRLEGSGLQASLRLRNLNDEPLELARLKISATVQDAPLASHEEARRVQVAANGFESVELTMSAAPEGARLLAELQAGEHSSLPFRLDGSVETSSGKIFRFEREGHVYPVPGKPGHFR